MTIPSNHLDSRSPMKSLRAAFMACLACNRALRRVDRVLGDGCNLQSERSGCVRTVFACCMLLRCCLSGLTITHICCNACRSTADVRAQGDLEVA